MNSKRDGHVHSHYCPHGSNDSFEEYLTKAIELGIEEITFTEHMTMPEGLVLHGIDKEFLSSAAPNIEEMKKYLKEGRRVTFLGDGVPVHKAKITEEILPGEAVTFAPANMNRQRAASVGTLGMQYYKEGKIETAMEHEPDYLRVSQAERERKERLGNV